MKLYFTIQFKRILRHFTDFGLPALIGFLLLGFAFVYGSMYVFDKIAYPQYIYPLLTLPILLALAAENRNAFIKNIFSNIDYKVIRCLENVIIAIPFVVFLGYKSFYILAAALIPFAAIVSLISTNFSSNVAIPTPFGKYPFEFTIGFRKSFLLFIPLYALVYLAVSVPNYNLGLFSIFGVCLVCIGFVIQPEPKYYVSIFNFTPIKFLNTKIKTTLLYTFFLCLPIILVLCIFNIEQIEKTLLGLGLGLALTVLGVLSKYATYPHNLSLVFGVLLVVSLLFPPILIALIPYLYIQSIKKLNSLLK